MKIIQVIPEFSMGGAETMCENLSTELLRQGHTVKVVSLYRTHSAITDRLERHNIPVIYLGKRLGFDFTIIFKLIKLFQKEHPDIVHTHLYTMKYAIPAAILTGIKGRVHTVHNIAQKEATPLNIKLNRLFYKLCNVVPVALSKEVQKTICDTYDLPGSRIPIVLNGIDLHNCIVKNTYEPKKERINILHIGRFSEQKNHIGLIHGFFEAHKCCSNCELNLVGDGELRGAMELEVEHLGLQNDVHFWGLQDNVFPFLHSADIFVLPSNYEGIPMTLIEAMGTGLPIIATKVGGIPDMLKNGVEAILIDNKEMELARNIVTLIRQPELRKVLGCSARVRAEMFSSESMGKGYLRIYMDTLYN